MKTITTEELKNMSHQEGLILQGVAVTFRNG